MIRHSFPSHLNRIARHNTTKAPYNQIGFVQLKSDGHYEHCGHSFDAIKAVIVVLLVWLEIGSNKDV